MPLSAGSYRSIALEGIRLDGLPRASGGDVQVASRVDELDRTADCYLFAVPDTAIAEVAESLSAHEVGRDALWVHVSGATPLEALSHCHRDAAVLYPLQTFSEGRELDFRKVPLLSRGDDSRGKDGCGISWS